MSKDADILDALKTRLESILITSGYQTNVGQKVEIWRDTDLAAADVPIALIQDIETEHDNGAVMNMTRNTMTVNVGAAMIGTISDARKLRSDLKKCLHGYETVGGLANSLSVNKSTVATKHEEVRFATAQLIVTIIYDTARDAI